VTGELVRLFFPEWQGHPVGDGTRRGAYLLRRQVCQDLPFADVPVVTHGSTATEGGIVARQTVVQNTRSCRNLLEKLGPRRLLTLGGTCAVELAPVSHLNRLYGGDLAVVWADAHADLNTPSTSPSGHFHGMPLRTLLGAGDAELVSLCAAPLLPEQVLLLGVRDTDPAERDYLAASGISVLDVGTTPEALVRRLEQTGRRHVYLHLDLDVLEPGDFDDVACPAPGGIRYPRLLELLEAAGRHAAVVGCSLLELVPGRLPRLDKLSGIVAELERCLRRPGRER
jgi:arginase